MNIISRIKSVEVDFVLPKEFDLLLLGRVFQGILTNRPDNLGTITLYGLFGTVVKVAVSNCNDKEQFNRTIDWLKLQLSQKLS